MTALDMLVLIALGASAVFGFMRGFVQEVLSLLAWVLAIFAVRMFLAPVTDMVGIWLGGTGGAAILSFVVLFGVTFLAGKFLARKIGQTSRSSFLGPIDRVLGGGFGAIKGLIGATLLFLGFSLVYNVIYGANVPRPEWMSQARSYPLLNASGDAMSRFAQYRTGQGAAGDADAARAVAEDRD
jgi:membrane protein required for colicin V production